MKKTSIISKLFILAIAIIGVNLFILCSCDDYIANFLPHDHIFGEWETVKESTCREDGEKQHSCFVCGEVESESIPKKPHTEGEWQITEDATCAEGGMRQTKCTSCGEIVRTEAITALGHTEEILPAVDATCTEEGLTEGKKCSVCEEVLVAQETVPALGHTEEILPAVGATCTEAGLTEGKKCSLCEEVLVAQETVPTIQHKMSKWQVVDPDADADDRMFERVCETCGGSEQMDLYERFAELTYVTFGDSITYGIDGVDWGLMEDPYPELVSNALGFKAFNNQAVSGATYCENTLNRTNMTKKILSFAGEADIISLMLGVNDCYVGLPLGTPESRDNTTIYGSLFLISEYLTKNYEDALIFYMTPFPYRTCYSNNSAGYKLEDVANAIKYVAAHYDIPVLDMYLYSEYENNGMHLGDGLHPSQSFMRDYTTPKIVSFIKEHYGTE